MISTRALLLVITAVGILLVTNSADGIVIDNFNSGDAAVVSVFSPGPTNTATIDAIGGSRTLEALSGSAGATSLAVAGGELNHGQSGVSGGTSSVTWDGNSSGLGGVDLTDGGTTNGVSLEVVSIDVGSVDLQLTVEDTGANISTRSLTGLGAGTQNFLFSSFTGSADFEDADSIVLTITAQASSDLTLDFLETIDVPNSAVPEPSSLALFSIGLLAVVRRPRRGNAAPTNAARL